MSIVRFYPLISHFVTASPEGEAKSFGYPAIQLLLNYSDL